jgi:hypothetical protein
VCLSRPARDGKDRLSRIFTHRDHLIVSQPTDR